MTRGNGKGPTSLMPTEVGDPYFPGARGGAGSDCAQATPQTVQTIAWSGALRQAPRGLQAFSQDHPGHHRPGGSADDRRREQQHDDPRKAHPARQQRPQQRHASPRATARMALITTRTADSRAQP